MIDNVYLYKCNSYNEKDIKEAMDKLIASFDVLKNIKKGTRVVIKANLVSPMGPEKSATTNPELLKYLSSYLLSKGASVIIGDSPSGLYTKGALSHTYKATGLDIIPDVLNQNFNIKSTVYKDAKVLKSFEYTSYLDDADIRINFCKLKTHGMMNMSCAVKNLFGCIPGTIKPEYHYRFPNQKDFANMLIDINEYFKFDINLVDGVSAMEGNGPTQGTPKHVGVLLGSINPYALDSICAKLIGLSDDDVETIKQSKDRNLFNKDNIKLNDDIDKYIIKDFKLIGKLESLKFYSNSDNLLSKFVSVIARKAFVNQPECNKSKCIGCQKCFNMCPAKAIKMVNNKPVIDRKKCIKCYCCQEFCPIGAMQVKKSWFAKLIRNKKK